MTTDEVLEGQIENCIQECLTCYALCTEMSLHCLKLGGDCATPEHISLLKDCATICRMTADFLLRRSSIHSRLCELCMDICFRCAKECVRIGSEDEGLLNCAEACRRSAEACEKMTPHVQYQAMVTRIDASTRFLGIYGWLKTYYLFSFSQYFDPRNIQFGVLRVFNDDTISAYSGFDEHHHENMEIVTLVLEGQLTHQDSLGNREVIKAGEIQRMSAGTGVVHAEKNLGEEPVHLYQLWFLPEKDGFPPSYEQKDVSYIEKNTLVPVVSNRKVGEVIHLSADVTLFLANLESEKTLHYTLSDGRGVFIYVKSGELEINGVVFFQGDQARIVEEQQLTLHAIQSTSFVFIDVGGVE